MRCAICDTLLVAPRYNKEIKTWEPCETCTEAIYDCLRDFKDQAVFYDEADLDIQVEIPKEDKQLSLFG